MTISFFKINNYLLFIILLGFIFYISLGNFEDKYFTLIFVPIIFTLFSFLETKYYKNYTVMMIILYVLSVFKFFITPISIISSGNINIYGPAPTQESFNDAIIILILEIITLFIAKKIFFYNNIVINRKIKPIIFLKDYTKNINIKFIIIFLGFAFFLVFKSNLMLPKDIFSDRNYDEVKNNKDSLSIVAKWIKLIGFPIITLFLLNVIKNKKRVYLLSLIVFLVFGYLQIGTSRWTLIFYTIFSFIFLYKIFGDKVKKVIIPVSGILIFLILSISIYKFSWALNGTDDKFSAIVSVMGNQLQAYFSGPSLIGQSIDIENSNYANKISYITFFNDFFGSIPLLSSKIDQTNRINYIFNQLVFGFSGDNQTQIIPMSGSGYLYFGLFGSTIFVFVFTYLGLKLEKHANKTQDIINYWILIYMSIWCISSIIFNFQIIWGNIVANYIILYIFNYLLSKYNFHR